MTKSQECKLSLNYHELQSFIHKLSYTCTGDTGLRGPDGEAGIPGTKGDKGDQGDY